MAEIDEYLKKCQEYAEKNGFKLNPKPEGIILGLLKNEEKYGKKYCPCQRISGNKEEDAKKICPCAFHKQEIEKNGRCFCNLYLKKTY